MNKKATWMALLGAMGFIVAIIISFTTIQTPFNPNATVAYEPLGTTELEIYQTYQTGEVCLNYIDMMVYNSASKADTEELFTIYFGLYLEGFNTFCNTSYEIDDFTIKHSINYDEITYTIETPIPITFSRDNYEYNLPVYSLATVAYTGSLI